MRGLTESGKGASVDLSTFGRNASGQGWISQQLIAKRETISPLQHGCGENAALAQWSLTVFDEQS
jgi:hypothetical protein